MKPIDILSNEHRVIEVVLDALERLADESRKSRKLELEPAKNALKFIRNFADRCHHGKEEDLLFTKIYERGMPRGVGPVAVMLDEHELGRRYVRDMLAAVRLDPNLAPDPDVHGPPVLRALAAAKARVGELDQVVLRLEVTPADATVLPEKPAPAVPTPAPPADPMLTPDRPMPAVPTLAPEVPAPAVPTPPAATP